MEYGNMIAYRFLRKTRRHRWELLSWQYLPDDRDTRTQLEKEVADRQAYNRQYGLPHSEYAAFVIPADEPHEILYWARDKDLVAYEKITVSS